MNHQGNSPASRDIASHIHGYTNLKAHRENGPFIITRGEGVRIFDDAGNAYIAVSYTHLTLPTIYSV